MLPDTCMHLLLWFIMSLNFNICHAQLLTDEELLKQGYEPLDIFVFRDATETDVEVKPDQMPQYPGGLQGLLSDFYSHVQYPAMARRKGMQAKFLIRYVIERDGSISEIEVIEHEGIVHQSFKDAGLNGIKNLKTWYPGFIDGDPVRVQFTQPVTFKLTKD